jgi:hypothetical protein
VAATWCPPATTNCGWPPSTGDTEVDLAERRVVTRLSGFVGNEVSIAAAGGYLWATSVEQPTLFRINPDTGQVVERGDIDAAGSWLPGRGHVTGRDPLGRRRARPDRRTRPPNRRHTESYELPVPEGVDPNTYYRGGITTGFGSVWATIFDEFYETTPSYASNADEPADSESLASSNVSRCGVNLRGCVKRS